MPEQVKVYAVGDVPATLELELLDGSVGRYTLHVSDSDSVQSFYCGPCPGCVEKGLRGGSFFVDESGQYGIGCGVESPEHQRIARVAIPLERKDGRGSIGLRFVSAKDWTAPSGVSTHPVCDERAWHAGCFVGSIVKGAWRRARPLRDWGTNYAR